MTGCADLSLRLNQKAWAILHLLAEMPPEFADWHDRAREYDLELKTFPWFNGQERGAVITLQQSDTDNQALHLAFAECRSSEEVFVEVWEDAAPYNAPTVGTCNQDARDRAYRNRREFDRIGEAVKYIYQQMENYYERAQGK